MAPVLADRSFPLPPNPSQLNGAEVDRPPSGIEVGEALREAREQEEAEQRARETPQAVAEREATRTAYTDLGATGAAQLIEDRFGEQLATLDADPARALSDARLERVLGPTEARISLQGDGMLVEGTVPVRAHDDDGELKKVDLHLEASAGELSPVNPLVDVSLPSEAGERIEFKGAGISIAPPTSQAGAGSTAHRFGDKDVLYPETQPDTDTLAAPTSGGVEIFSQLRSPQSPADLRFHLTLPAGAELRPDGHGGAEVVRSGDLLAFVSIPHATDAQGAAVPVAMSVEGNDLLLAVDHGGGDFAYPILVDPEVTIAENWYDNGRSWYYDSANLGALGYWNFSANSSRFSGGTAWKSPFPHVGASERGLFIHANSTTGTQPANSHGEWTLTPPGQDTFFVAALIRPFWIFANGCGQGTYPEPHDYSGFWSSTWGWGTFNRDQARVYEYGIDIAPGEQDWHHGIGHILVIGLGTEAGSTAPPVGCPRDLFAGGVAFWMDDWYKPTTSVSGVPSGWINGETPISITVNAADTGLGVQTITLLNDGKGIVSQDQVGCTGLFESPCPGSRTSHLNLTGTSLGEGIRSASVAASDPTGKLSEPFVFQTRVDRSKPVVSLDGQLAEATEADEGEAKGDEDVEKLRLSVYKLQIKTTDIGTETDANLKKRSGVEDIEVFLDNEEMPVPWEPTPSCPQTSCERDETYTLKLSEIDTAGIHKLEVRVTDFAGNEKVRDVEFEYIPATGIKDEYLMQYFPLPDGQGDEEAEGHPRRPELAVNVMNGNLVYRQTDVDVESSAAVNLEVERYYNSQLPDAESTEWGDGWTLAETPDLKPIEGGGSGDPEAAELLDSSGAVESEVELPAEAGEEKFDPELRATLKKKASGGYLMTDETGESSTAIAFDETGRTEALVTEGAAKVDYGYEGDALAEIAVEDAGTLSTDPAEVEMPEPEPTEGTPHFHSAFGSLGSGDTEFNTPTDVAIGADGDLWVADYANNRVQHLNPAGEYVGQFGSQGTGPGELQNPASLALDAEGDLWVADKNNSRVQEFSPDGEYLGQFGSQGSGGGQLNRPEGIAIDASGDIWVSDTYNYRVQRFTPEGEFVEVVAPEGLGAIEPTGIDAGPDGKVWVTDWSHNRVVALSEGGDLELSFGTAGSGPGQFSHPDAIEADENGYVWVGDQNNGRIQRFDQDGDYVDQFGSKGSGEGQFSFSYPFGFAVGEDHRLWVADRNNHRVQRWDPPFILSAEALPEDDDPRVEVATEDGLVEAVSGEEAGQTDYEHDGELLTSVDGPDGETEYEYDEAELLTKVTLANGTYGEVSYFSDGRVESVTVASEGVNPKTTYFAYTDAPSRRTVVDPPDAPHVTYDIGEDGSVLKWWNTAKPPELSLAGTLYDHREEDGGLWAGDHELQVQAEDDEGIESVQIIIGGDLLVEELKCEQVGGPPIECTKPEALPWVMETEANPPGHLQIEAIATDSEGESASERFWVDVPEPPPPPAPGTPIAPRFAEIKRFRAEYGLEVNFPVANQIEQNERIFNLIKAWYEPSTPAGQVARASWERWGVPLRPEDVAELEYREWLYEANAEKIDQWVEATSPGSYAGYYMDHPAGGIMRIGFLGDQSSQLASLETSLSLIGGNSMVGGSSRLSVYPTPPTVPYVAVRATTETVLGAIESNPNLANLVVDVEDDEAGRYTRVSTPNVAQVESILNQMVGANAPVTVEYEAGGGALLDGRYRNSGRMRAGDYISGHGYSEQGVDLGPSYCTAGFGAMDGKRLFVLTAGHCYTKLDTEIWRAEYDGDSEFPFDDAGKSEVGRVARSAFNLDEYGGVRTDGVAIRIKQGGIVPRAIWGWDGHALPTKPAGRARKGNTLCYSGAISKTVACGRIVARSLNWRSDDAPFGVAGYWVRFPEDKRPQHGDSGSPVWNLRTGASIGLVSAGRPEGSYIETLVAPLLHPPNMPTDRVPGILRQQNMRPLQLKLGG